MTPSCPPTTYPIETKPERGIVHKGQIFCDCDSVIWYKGERRVKEYKPVVNWDLLNFYFFLSWLLFVT